MADGIAMDTPVDDASDSQHGYSGDDDSTDDGSRDRSSDFERPSWIRQTPEVSLVEEEGSGQDSKVPAVSVSESSSAASVKSSPQRSRFRFSLLSPLSAEFPPTPSTSSPSSAELNTQDPETPESSRSPRNHQRRATGGQTLTPALLMSPLIATAPTPAIRARHRAISHPDISSLCQEWINSGPANRTTCYTVDVNDDNNCT